MHLGVRGTGFAIADVFQGAGRENHSVLRHDADALAQIKQGDVARGHTVQEDGVLPCIRRNRARTSVRVIKPQQKLKHRALARATGPDQRHSFTRFHVQREVAQRRGRRARRVMKIHRLKTHGTAGDGGWQLQSLCRRFNRRLAMQQLHQPLGGTGRAQQIAIDFAQHRKGTRQNDHVDHGLPQVAGCDAPGHYGLRALVQAP